MTFVRSAKPEEVMQRMGNGRHSDSIQGAVKDLHFGSLNCYGGPFATPSHTVDPKILSNVTKVVSGPLRD